MESVNKQTRNLPSLIQRIARIWSILCFGFFVFIIIMEILFPHSREGWRPRDVVLAAFIPVGVFFKHGIGMAQGGLRRNYYYTECNWLLRGDVYSG